MRGRCQAGSSGGGVFPDLAGGLSEFGPGGYLLMTLSIAAGVLVLTPTTPMAIAAGLAYGAHGVPAALLGATMGSAIASLIARHLVRERAISLAAARPTLWAVLRSIEH